MFAFSRKRPPKSRRWLRGFTLLETAFAIAVAGAVIGLSVPMVLSAKHKSANEKRLANVRTLTDANWRLEITGRGNNITRSGNNAEEARRYYADQGVLADADGISLDGLVFSNGVWGTTNDPASHFVKAASTVNTNKTPPRDTQGIIAQPTPDPNDNVLDLLKGTEINGTNALDLLKNLEGRTVEWVFEDTAKGTNWSSKVGRWDPKTGKSYYSGDGGDAGSLGGSGGSGSYGSGTVPSTVLSTNYNDDGTIASVSTNTVYTGGPTSELLECTTGTLVLNPAPGSRAGSVVGGGRYDIGAVAYIYAAPAAGWKFKRWVRTGTVSIVASSDFPLMQVPIDACSISYSAEFEPLPGYVKFDTGDNGQIILSGDGLEPITLYSYQSASAAGQNWQAAPLPDDNYLFRSWSAPPMYSPELTYRISSAGLLSVTGFRPGETSVFLANFTKIGDNGEDTSGCATKNVESSVYDADSGALGGPEMGSVAGNGVRYKSEQGFFGSIVAYPNTAGGYSFSHWVVSYIDRGTWTTRVVASTLKSFSLDTLNGCDINAKAYFRRDLFPSPSPSPGANSPFSYLLIDGDPTGTARFSYSGAGSGWSRGPARYYGYGVGARRISIIPDPGRSVSSVSMTGGKVLGELTKYSYYVNVAEGDNSFTAVTAEDAGAPTYTGLLHIWTSSTGSKKAGTVELLGSEQNAPVKSEEGIPIFGGQTLTVRLNMLDNTCLREIVASSPVVRVQPDGLDTYKIHITSLSMDSTVYLGFITGDTPPTPMVDPTPPDSYQKPAVEPHIQPFKVVIPDTTRLRLVENPAYTVTSGLDGDTVSIPEPTKGTTYTFTVETQPGYEHSFSHWSTAGVGDGASFSVSGNTLTVIPKSTYDFSQIKPEIVFTAITAPDTAYSQCDTLVFRLNGIDPTLGGGNYHRAGMIATSSINGEAWRNVYYRDDGKWRIAPVVSGNQTLWGVQKFVPIGDGEGGTGAPGLWIASSMIGSGTDTAADLSACPPGGSQLEANPADVAHKDDINPGGGVFDANGTLSLIARKGAGISWTVETTLPVAMPTAGDEAIPRPSATPQVVTTRSGYLASGKQITLMVAPNQVVVARAVSDTAAVSPRPWGHSLNSEFRIISEEDYQITAAPKAGRNVLISATGSGGADPSPSASASASAGEGLGTVKLRNGSIARILTASDLLMVHGTVGSWWTLVPGGQRTLDNGNLTGAHRLDWPVIVALRNSNFKWSANIPGALYSGDRRVVSVPKPGTGDTLELLSIDTTAADATPSPGPSATPTGEWGTVRITTRLSEQPWYFEIATSGSGVPAPVGIVGADTPLVMTEPPAGVNPQAASFRVYRNYSNLVFSSTGTISSESFVWPGPGQVKELTVIVQNVYPSPGGSASPGGGWTGNNSPSPSPSAPGGAVSLIVSPSWAAGYFSGESSSYKYGEIGKTYSVTARANQGWKLTRIRYSLPGSSTAYTTGLGDSLVFAMPALGTITAIFEPFTGASPTAGGDGDSGAALSLFTNTDGTSAQVPVSSSEVTLKGQATVKSGGVMCLDGDGDYAIYSGGADLNLSGTPFTIEAWVFPASLSGGDKVVVSKDTYGSNYSWSLVYNSTSMSCYTHDINGDWQFTVPANIVVGKWQHMALTFDGTTQRLFLDGKLLGSKEAPITDASSQVSIGASSWNNPGGFLNGSIAGLSITKGSAAYTSDFTVPSSPVGNACYTDAGGGYDVDILAIWTSMTQEERLAYGVDKAIAQGLPPYLLTVSEKAAANWETVWRLFGWKALTEGQKKAASLAQIWDKRDATGYTVGFADIKAGYNLSGISGYYYYWNAVGANLAGLNMANTRYFSYGNFSGANLAGVNFAGGGGWNNTYLGANLAGANFASYGYWSNNWWGVSSGGILGGDRDLGDGWRIVKGYIVGRGVNLAGGDLSDINFAGINLFGANLSGANLFGANLAGVNLFGGRFGGGGITSDANTKLPAGWTILGGYLFGPGANLAGADFSGLNLEGANFTGITFGNVKIDENTKLPEGWVYFEGYLISTQGVGSTGVDISGLDLSGKNLSSYNLAGWRGYNLSGTPSALPEGYGIVGGVLVGPGINFTGGNIAGLNLSSYNLYGSQITQMSNLSGVVLPDGWKTTGNSAVGPGALAVGLPYNIYLAFGEFGSINMSGGAVIGSSGVLYGANFAGSNFAGLRIVDSGAILRSSNLAGSNLAGIITSGSNSEILCYSNLWGANLAGSVLNRGSYVLSGSSAYGANFAGVNLAGITFYDVKFFGSNLAGVNLASCNGWNNNWWGVSSGGVLGGDRDLGSGWRVVGGYIVGPGVNLSGANLSGLNLMGYNLTGAMFGGGGVTVDANTKLPAGWTLQDGYVFGPGVNLAGADFSGLNLEGVNLTGITFGNVTVDANTKLPAGWEYFKGYIVPTTGVSGGSVNISSTNLAGADLSSYNLSGWQGYNLTGTPSALPAGYGIVSGVLVGPGVNLSGGNIAGLNLSSYNLYGAKILNMSDLSGATLPDGWKSASGSFVGPGADISGRYGTFAYQSSGSLAGVNLTGVNLAGTDSAFESANLMGATLSSINLEGSTMPFESTHMPGSTIDGLNLSGSYETFAGANLAGSTVTNINATGFLGASPFRQVTNIAGIWTSGIVGCEGNTFSPWQSTLVYSIRGGIILGPMVNLSGVNLDGVNLTGVNLSGALLGGGGISTDANTKLPAGWTVVGGYLFAPGGNFAGADFSGLNLEGVNLSGMTFGNVKVDADTKLPSGWIYFGGQIISTQGGGGAVEVSGFNLEGVDLSSYSLSGWRGYNLTGTPSALPEGYGIVGGVLAGPGVNLAGGNLAGLDLSSFNLAGAQIVKMSNLSGVTLPSNWKVSGDTAVGPGTSISGYSYFLSHQDLAGANLSGSSFSNINGSFRYSNLAGGDLSGSTLNLAGDSFQYVNLSGANLVGLTSNQTPYLFYNSNLAGANLAGAVSDQSQYVFYYSNLAGANLAGFVSTGESYSMYGANLVGANMTSVNLSGSFVCSLNLVGADLGGANLSSVQLWSANFTGANFAGANFTGLSAWANNWWGVSSGGVLGGNRGIGDYWSVINGYIVGPGVNLAGANLGGVNLLGIRLTDVNFGGGGVTVDANTKLPTGWVAKGGFVFGSGVNLSGANFSGLNLEGVNLSGVTFGNVTVDANTKLPAGWEYFKGYIVPTTGVSGGSVNISSTNLAGADLSSYNLSGWQGYNLTGTPSALPAGYGIVSGVLVGPGVDFSGGSLASLDLSSYNLFGAKFTGVTSVSGTTLPSGWMIVGNTPLGPGISYAGASRSTSAFNLSSLDLSGLNLFGVNFAGEFDVGAYSTYSGANLAGASFAGYRGNGYNSNFSGANLAGVNFSGQADNGNYNCWSSNFAGANLAGADFTNNSMSDGNWSGVSSGGIKGGNKDLGGGWEVIGGYIVGPTVNLTGANLSGLDLTSVSLSGATGTSVTVDANTKLPTGWKVVGGVLTAP